MLGFKIVGLKTAGLPDILSKSRVRDNKFDLGGGASQQCSQLCSPVLGSVLS